MDFLVVHAKKGFEAPLEKELGSRLLEKRGHLYWVKGSAPPVFAQNVWLEPQVRNFESIGEAAKILRDIQRNWVLEPLENVRRAKLIEAKLPPLKTRRVLFPSELPKAPIGSWTLLSGNELLFSAKTTSPFPHGQIEFEENKTDPPSRAYLKLWETFLLEQRLPKHNETCLDLGSSPGGWTWVLDQLEAQVISVDKAPLSDTLKLSARVKKLEESAFALKPESIGKVDWLFSDIICYPDRTMRLIESWANFARNFVCTIKFQGDEDYSILDNFKKFSGSRIRYLYHNKHEVTFVWLR